MVILSQNGAIAGDNTTAIINFHIENIGVNGRLNQNHKTYLLQG
jgi:hypothetical protein